ncbi:Cytosolic iron-sulfur assembly component 2B [Malassezia cuniculi]|uniref:Cytosolic iron-sulfur assembly component 2B n=1 Tax=Malassezia cuniculi TaxID=948313 RepID=A0AAF0J6Z6_9BASI|nr:Cytosolic iron-sulfur assembly component 2B [Malassezia cuniculi]
MDNANPIVYATHAVAREDGRHKSEWWRDTSLAPECGLFGDEDDVAAATEQNEVIDSREIFDLVRSITDPEHPLTLEQLAVVNEADIHVTDGETPTVLLEFTPTIPHCSMATLIGLSLRVRLLRALPAQYKVDIRIRPGTHQSENAINKQLNDKERVAAALENKHLLGVVQGCLATAALRGVDASA